jgi:hypothetical protein
MTPGEILSSGSCDSFYHMRRLYPRICFWNLGKEEGHTVVMFIYIQREAVYFEVTRSLPSYQTD